MLLRRAIREPADVLKQGRASGTPGLRARARPKRAPRNFGSSTQTAGDAWTNLYYPGWTAIGWVALSVD
jgi:hypothetical protein